MPTRFRLPPESPWVVLCAVLALGTPVPGARAQITEIQEVTPIEFEEEEEAPFIVLGVSLLGGMALHDMQDLNEALEIINDEIRDQGSFGIQFDPLDNGASIGGALRAVVAERFVWTTSYERFLASSTVGGVTSESRVEIPADVVSTTLGYDFLPSPYARFGFALGFGWYKSRAQQVITETLANQPEQELGRIRLEGSTVSPQYETFFETRFTDRLYVGLSGGYRSARIQDIEIQGLADLQEPRSDTAFISVPVAEDDPSGVRLRGGGDALDWSGFYGRVLMTYYVNAPSF